MIIDHIKKLAPQPKIFFHSCGAIRPIIPDLIEIGVDILNPLQPLASGMGSARLKEDFGSKLCFLGGVDIQHALYGTTEDVWNEVRRRITDFAPGGGYIVATSADIADDIPFENVLAYFDAVRQLSPYPA